MDFMFLDSDAGSVIDFDVRSEIVSKDSFFEKAKKYISTDKSTILHRQALFADIIKLDELKDFIFSLSEKMSEFTALRQFRPKDISNEEKLNNILYLNVYIDLIRFIYEALSPIANSLSSASLKQLFKLAKNDIESNEYARIKSYYAKNAEKIRSVNSVTVGINLDGMFRPKEAGILALNQEKFRSGDLIDRIMRMDFDRDCFHCIAPLTVIDKKLGYRESQQVNYALLGAMGKVLSHGLQHCSRSILKYVKEKLDRYFELLGSLDFIVEAIKRINMLQEKNIPLCFPKISDDRSYSIVSLYSDSLARTKSKKEIVPYTVELEKNICCYILTGPNSGGKTVFINALASSQYCFQLGMPIPAKEAVLPICDAIFKVSVEEQANAGAVGRFEKECISLSKVLERFTPNSLALIDEAFTSTSASEALPIAENFINELCNLGGKAVFITHYHELCELSFGEAVGYLHTESRDDRRSYAIHNGRSSPNSYARNIAKKYGLITE